MPLTYPSSLRLNSLSFSSFVCCLLVVFVVVLEVTEPDGEFRLLISSRSDDLFVSIGWSGDVGAEVVLSNSGWL